MTKPNRGHLYRLTWSMTAHFPSLNDAAALRHVKEVVDLSRPQLKQNKFGDSVSPIGSPELRCETDHDRMLTLETPDESKAFREAVVSGLVFDFDEVPPLPKKVFEQAEALPRSAQAALLTMETVLVERGGLLDSRFVDTEADLLRAQKLITTGKVAQKDISEQQPNDAWVRLSPNGWLTAWALRYARSQELLQRNPIPKPAKRRAGPAKKVVKKNARSGKSGQKALRAPKPAGKKRTRK